MLMMIMILVPGVKKGWRRDWGGGGGRMRGKKRVIGNIPIKTKDEGIKNNRTGIFSAILIPNLNHGLLAELLSIRLHKKERYG